jgi:hypothetical protein
LVDKKVKQKLDYASKNWPENLKKYGSRKKHWVIVTVIQKPILMLPS